MAEETGGFAVLNNNDIGVGLKRILDDNEVYYLLAYEPASSRRAGRFRSIQVRLPARPDLVARTRKGYFEPRDTRSPGSRETPSPKRAAAEAQERVRDAFRSIVPLRGLPVHLAADFIDLPDVGPTVVVNVGRGHGVPPTPRADRRRGSVEIVGLVSDREGAVVEPFAQVLSARPAARGPQLGAAGPRGLQPLVRPEGRSLPGKGGGPGRGPRRDRERVAVDRGARSRGPAARAEQPLPRAGARRFRGAPRSRGRGRGRAPRPGPAEVPGRQRHRRRPFRLQRPNRRRGRAPTWPSVSSSGRRAD